MQISHLNTEIGIELVMTKMSFDAAAADDDADSYKTQQRSAAQDSL